MALDVSRFILFSLFIGKSISTFEMQFLGNYLSDDQYQSLEFCSNEYCIADSDRLFYAATQNTSVEPCDDFKEFSVGSFLKYRALNER